MSTSPFDGMAFGKSVGSALKTSDKNHRQSRRKAAGMIFSLALVLVLLGITVGCASRSALVPGPGTTTEPGNALAVISTVDSVHMEVDAEAWKGQQIILEKITPLKIIIRNDSGKPLKIDYRDFALTDLKGKRFSALPPYGITGTVEKPILVQGYPAIYSPDFDYDGFWVAPYYAPIYPDIPDWDEPFYYDPWYYDQYYTYWKTIHLPTEQMLRRALPAGVLDSGGHLTGFLYFQEISTSDKDVTFTANLVDAKTGEIFGTISIPFKVIRAS